MAAKKRAKKASKKPTKKLTRTRAKKPAKRAASAKRPVRAAGGRSAKRVAKPVARKKPKPVAKKKVARAKPLRRRDGAGHLDPSYAAKLRELGAEREVDPEGFVDRPRSKDDLVEQLGEEYVGSATSGEYEAEDRQNQDVTEEVGGPFVQTTGKDEFAEGTDASNPKGASREPFPRT